MTTALMFLSGVVLATGTFIFVSVEPSLVTVDRTVLDRRVEEEDYGAAPVLRATCMLSTQLLGVQVGTTLTTTLLGYTTQNVLADLLEDLLGSIGSAWGLAISIVAFVAVTFIDVFSILSSELVPKSLAPTHPLVTAVRVVPFQMVFTTITRPVIWVLGGTANWVFACMGTESQEEISSARSASELAALVRRSVEEGTFDMPMTDPFVGVIHISTLGATDVMTNRGRLHTLSESDSVRDVLDLTREIGHPRFPVIGDDSDNILDLVPLRRVVTVPAGRRAEVPVISSSLMADAPSVPEAAPVGPLMVRLRDGGLQMAVVVDEYGGVLSTVTLGGVIEEIVDEVSDGHDQRRFGTRPCPGGTFLVPDTLRPDEPTHRTDINLPEDGPYDTIGDPVMNELGEVPVVGSRVNVGNIGIEVTRMQRRRVAQVAITLAPEAENEEVSLWAWGLVSRPS